MPKSMTGFGRAERVTEAEKYTVEIKSVNNRYLDFNIRMPRRFNVFESRIRSLLTESIERGKVDVFITYEAYEAAAGSLRFHEAMARQYLAHLRSIAAMEGVAEEIRVSDVARCPDVFTTGEAEFDEDAVWDILSGLLREAAERFVAMRAAEGEHLAENIRSKLDLLAKGADEIEKHEPEIMAAYRAKLRAKLDEVLADTQIDEGRIAAELVLYSDKICTDEETVRLKSHIEKVRRILDEKGSIGRSLDFMAQEMNREANTILSKAGDVLTADTAIILKTEIEKIREQIQNLE